MVRLVPRLQAIRYVTPIPIEHKMSTDSKSKKTETPLSDAKAKAAQMAIDQIEKQFGKGSIMRLTDKNVVNVEAISTGCLSHYRDLWS